MKIRLHRKKSSYSEYDRECIVSDYVGYYREMFTEEIDLNPETINAMTTDEFDRFCDKLQEFNNHNKINFYE